MSETALQPDTEPVPPIDTLDEPTGPSPEDHRESVMDAISKLREDFTSSVREAAIYICIGGHEADRAKAILVECNLSMANQDVDLTGAFADLPDTPGSEVGFRCGASIVDVGRVASSTLRRRIG